MTDVNILFTSVGRRVELLRCFRQAYEEMQIGGRIIAIDIDPLAPALREADQAYLVPRLDSPDYIPCLLEILSRENVTVVFPLIDPDIPVLAANRKVLEVTGASLAVVSTQASKIADDKWNTVAFFDGLGIPSPRSWLPDSINHATAEYPLFIKPRSGSASQNTFKVENAEELSFFSNYISKPIIQAFLPGPEITSDVICDLEGNVLSVVSRQRIRVRGGEVVVGKTVIDKTIKDACMRIARELPATGPITVQCIMNGASPCFTEINARLGGGVPLGIAAGDDWPRRLLARLAGLELDTSGFRSYVGDVYLSRFDDSVFATENERVRMAGQNGNWEAVIFDLDDTLYAESDYVLSGFKAVSAWAKETLGFSETNTYEELKQLFDDGIRGNTFDLWLRNKGLQPDDWRESMVQAYRDHRPSIALSNEVSELLDELQTSFQVGLITDGYLSVQQRKVTALGLQDRLDCVVYSDALGCDAWKPSPRPFEEALSRLGVEANRAVYIGDNPAKDFRGAAGLGMATIRVRLPGRLHCDAEALHKEDEADTQISNLSELTSALLEMAQRRFVSHTKPIRIDRPVASPTEPAKTEKLPTSATNRIYLSPPHMSPQSRSLLLEAFDSNWIAPLGPHVDLLEEEFAEQLAASAAVALSSGTAALHLALVALGVGPGDEVFTSTLTFAATANAIRYVGATPVFIDSDEETWNMDPRLLDEELEAAARRGKMPKAVITVDLYGQCADYEPILESCRRYNVAVIEDAAEALGATYRGTSAGNFGTVGCFSFNGNKIITASSGGMLVSQRPEVAEKIRHLATQARDPAVHYEHSLVGYNYRMSNLLAAVARGQLEVLEDRVYSRRANFNFYEENLGELPGVSFMPEIAGGRSNRWLTCLTVNPKLFGATREDIRLALEAENIESRPVWKPMHMQPVNADCRTRGGRIAQQLFEDGLCLPSGSDLNDEDRRRIADIVRSVYMSNAQTHCRVRA